MILRETEQSGNWCSHCVFLFCYCRLNDAIQTARASQMSRVWEGSVRRRGEVSMRQEIP